MKKVFLFIGLFQIFSSTIASFAQEKEHHNYFIESVYQYGFIWQHRPSLAQIIGGNINVIRFTFGKETFGQKYWEQLYRYPDWGVGYSFTDLGNPEELGQANAIYSYLRVPILKRKKFSLSYKISGGLAYLNKGNIAIGSHINLYFDVSIDTKIKLGKQLELINSFGASHYSNGAIKMPNLGVNLFSYRLGLHYQLQTPEREKITPELPELYGKNCITLFAGAGVKEKRPDGGKKFTVASGSVDYMRVLNLKHKIGLGIDAFYDETLFDLMDPDSVLALTNKDIMRYGFHISGETQVNKLVLVVQIGTYFHANYTHDGKIYQRIAIRYLLSQNLFANVSLKTSKGVADYVEWGLGYQLFWK